MTTILRSLKDAHKNITSMAGLIGPESNAPGSVIAYFEKTVIWLEILMQTVQGVELDRRHPDVWAKIATVILIYSQGD